MATIALAATDGCPECGAAVARDDRETYCEGCGLVVDEDPIDRGPEWRSFDDRDTDRERTGAPWTVARHDRGHATTIGNAGDFRQLSGAKKRHITRLRRWHSRSQAPSKIDRNERYGMTEMRRIASAVDLPRSVRDRACTLFRDAHEADLARGRDLDALAAAAIYAAARLTGLARTFDEVAGAARVDKDTVRMGYAAINTHLDLPIAPPQVHEYLPRIASRVDAPSDVERAARRLLDAADQSVIVGKKPQGLAAGALWAVSDTITQAALADASDTTAVTIRSAARALQEEADDDQ